MTSPTGRQWPTPAGAVGVALTGAALGVVAVIVVVGAGLNKPMLLLPIAVIVLGVAGVRWLFAIWPRRATYPHPQNRTDEPAAYEDQAYDQQLPTYDEDRWAEEYPDRAEHAEEVDGEYEEQAV